MGDYKKYAATCVGGISPAVVEFLMTGEVTALIAGAVGITLGLSTYVVLVLWEKWNVEKSSAVAASVGNDGIKERQTSWLPNKLREYGIKVFSVVFRHYRIVGIVIGVCILLLIIPILPEPAEWQWTHPSLSESEVHQAENDCLMKSYEVLGGGLGRGYDRQTYIEACMEGQGFTWQKVEP